MEARARGEYFVVDLTDGARLAARLLGALRLVAGGRGAVDEAARIAAESGAVEGAAEARSAHALLAGRLTGQIDGGAGLLQARADGTWEQRAPELVAAEGVVASTVTGHGGAAGGDEALLLLLLLVLLPLCAVGAGVLRQRSLSKYGRVDAAGMGAEAAQMVEETMPTTAGLRAGWQRSITPTLGVALDRVRGRGVCAVMMGEVRGGRAQRA